MRKDRSDLIFWWTRDKYVDKPRKRFCGPRRTTHAAWANLTVRSGMMNEIDRIQQGYRNQCDDDWEHAYGVKIDTLDNPGWSLPVDLIGTALEQAPFDPIAYRVGENSEPEGEDWYVCKTEDSQFKGFGGPNHLKTLLNVFLSWAEKE